VLRWWLDAAREAYRYAVVDPRADRWGLTLIQEKECERFERNIEEAAQKIVDSMRQVVAANRRRRQENRRAP
jgi:hypothetical protein